MNFNNSDSVRGPEDISVPIHISPQVCDPQRKETVPYAVEYANGSFDLYGKGEPQFKILAKTRLDYVRLLNLDSYSLAMAFIRDEFSVEGDIAQAARFYLSAPSRRRRIGLLTGLAIFTTGWLESWFQTKARAVRNIRYHYDQSTDFYRQFLDPRMVYSCAYFHSPEQSLEEAQLRKLDHICRKLDLQTRETFLDIGCGWGGLITHSAEEYGVVSTGCTLSAEQFEFANREVADRHLAERVRVELSDYRDMEGSFDKIASVGMFEHVGRRRLRAYFKRLHKLLRPGGLLLNHGITRPESVHDGPETLFIRRKVFPGGELAHLSEVVRAAELAGFEVVDIENLRPHYALTCRAWVRRMQENVTQCLRHIDRSAYRTWLLALAASAIFFEDGRLNVNQLLLHKPGDPARRPFTREYMYV